MLPWDLVTHPKRVVGPRRPLHFTDLDVKGEILHAYVARGFVNPVREPSDYTRMIDENVGVDDGRVIARIRAENDVH